MKHLTFFLIIFITPFCLLAQVGDTKTDENEQIISQDAKVIVAKKKPGQEKVTQKDSLQKPPISAYKIFSISGDSTYVDTTLSIQKDYKFNYLRKDNFELVPFNNVGQTYNKLGYSFKKDNIVPDLGARARHFNFMEVEDIYYSKVPTPLT